MGPRRSDTASTTTADIPEDVACGPQYGGSATSPAEDGADSAVGLDHRETQVIHDDLQARHGGLALTLGSEQGDVREGELEGVRGGRGGDLVWSSPETMPLRLQLRQCPADDIGARRGSVRSRSDRA